MLWDICTLCSTCVKEDIELNGRVYSSFVSFDVFIESPGCVSVHFKYRTTVDAFSSVSFEPEANHTFFPLSAAFKLRWTLCVISTSEKIFFASAHVGLPEKIELLFSMLRNQLWSGCHCYQTLTLPNLLIFKLFFFNELHCCCGVCQWYSTAVISFYFFKKMRGYIQIQTVHMSLLCVWFMIQKSWPQWMFVI